MATPTSSGPSEPRLKGKEREHELENDGNPAVFFANPQHNNSQSREYEHRMANYVKGKILDNKPLSYANKDSWFLSLKLWAKSNGLWYIISNDEEAITRRNEEKNMALYSSQNATVFNSLLASVGEDDLETAQEFDLAHDFVQELEKKYKTVLQSTSQEQQSKFYAFKMKNHHGVREAYAELRQLARKIKEFDPRQASVLSPEFIFERLVGSLPLPMVSTGRALLGRKATIEEGLRELQETELQLGLRLSNKKEKAHFSKHKTHRRPSLSKSPSRSPSRGRPRQIRRRSRPSSSSSSSSPSSSTGSKNRTCFQCNQPGHFADQCPNKDLMLKLLNEHLRKSSLKSSPKPSSRKSSSQQHSRSPSRESRGKKKSVRFSSNQALVADSETDHEKKPNANSAISEESSCDEQARVAAVMVGPAADAAYFVSAKASRHTGEISHMASQSYVRSSDWIYDSGATAHMTDQIDAFESDPRVNESGRRKVKVGGGSLCIRGRGTVSVELARSKMRLHNALFVPNLGANLVSSSRIVPKGFYAVHDDKLYTVMRYSDNQVTFQAERLNDDSLWTAIWAANDIADQTEEAYPANETVGANTNDRHQTEAEFDESRLYQMGTSKARTFQEYNKWHCRLGHVNGRKLRYLHEVSNLPDAIPAKSPIEYKCDACSTAKAKKNRNHELSERAKQPLDLVSADICGPFPTSKHWEEHYFLEAIDNYTRRSVIFTGSTRASCAEQMFDWKKRAETQTDKRLKAIRIDNANELESRALRWAEESGVEYQPTAPYTSSQNGTAERALQSTQAIMRSMLAHAQLSEDYWNLAAKAASHVKNRLPDGPDGVNEDKSTFRQCPDQAWFKRKPRVTTLRIFGSKCFVYNNKRENKASQRGEVGIFLGYSGNAQYYVEILETGALKRVDAAQVLVDEGVPGGTLLIGSTKGSPLSLRVGDRIETLANCSHQGNAQGTLINLSQQGDAQATLIDCNRQGPSLTTSTTLDKLDRKRQPPNATRFDYTVQPNSRDPSADNNANSDSVGVELSSSTVSESVGVTFKTPQVLPQRQEITIEPRRLRDSPTSQSKGLQRFKGVSIPAPAPKASKRNAEDDISPDDSKKVRLTLEEVKEAIRNTAPEIDTVMAQMAFLVRATEADQLDGIKNRVPIPTNHQSAITDPIHGLKWQEAIQREINELIGNRTWEEEKLRDGVNEVTSKWVFTVKYNIDGSIERYKARLVARGFTQIYGQDFEETFAPTIRIDSLRMLMAIMAVEDMEAEQVDVNNAFTESKLRETIYMKPPLGVEIRPGSTLRLLQSLYGLKQSAREWYLRCSKVLKGIGFKSINSDPCVFIHKNGAIIGLYVDDLVILTPKGNLQAMVDIKDSLSFAFKIKELGAIKRILGIRIHRVRDRCRVYLDQQAYIEKFLHEFAMENPTVKDTAIPISDANSLHRLQDDEELGEIRDYQRKIGSTMFAMVYSRPDICFAMSKLSQYMSNPSVHHEAAVKHLLRYLRTTKAFRICYRASGPKQITGYSDSDFAADKDDRKSVSGFVFTFAGGPISWASRKQKSVTTSTAEAELMALVPATKHAIWLSKFLYEIERSQFIGPNGRTVIMNEDNQAAIKMVNNNQISERSKHIDIGCHFVRERSENQDIKVQYCHTDEMTADGCTKGLAKAKFQSFLKLLGLRVSKDESTYIALTSTRPAQLGLAKGHYLFRASSIVGMQRAVRPSSSPC